MQQTKSYWRLVAVAGVMSAFTASACVVTSSTDDSVAGGTGDGETAGSPGTGGGTSAGAGNTAGTGGSGDEPFQCDTGDGGAPPGTPADCSPDASHPNDACALCVQAHCCTEFAECYATSPGNQCGYGGPNDGGEITCMQTCLQNGFKQTMVDDPDLRTMCEGQCATSTTNHGTMDCGDLIGVQTNALLSCLSDNCLDECIGG